MPKRRISAVPAGTSGSQSLRSAGARIATTKATGVTMKVSQRTPLDSAMPTRAASLGRLTVRLTAGTSTSAVRQLISERSRVGRIPTW